MRALVLTLAACASGTPCDRISGAPPTSEADLTDLLAQARDVGFPELADLRVALRAYAADDGSFFSTNVELATVDLPPFDRQYLVLYDPALFADPPPAAAVGAILVHELAHARDYTGMTADELGAFAIWYATEDVAAYERQTDEAALERGCAEGLIAYREWLYAHIDPDLVPEKQRVYFTPEEIRDWQ